MQILYRDFFKLARFLAQHDRITRKKFKGGRVDANNTFFLHYPKAPKVRNKWTSYKNCREYFWYHKRGQRNALREYFNIPPKASRCDPPYIVRPVRHFGGRDFYVARSEEEVANVQRQMDRSYAVGVFRRTREFRVFYSGGEHINTMLKSLEDYGYAKKENMPPVEDDELQLQPWNRHQMGTRYLTVNNDINDKLQNTSFYEDARAFLQDHKFDLIAVDAAYNDHNKEYVVFETNFAPLCTIESTIQPILKKLQTKSISRLST